MDERRQGTKEGDPDPKRLQALRSLPKEVLETMTKEEIQAFLHLDTWPDSLREKLSAYEVDPDEG